MEIKTWRDFKEFLNTLDEKQLDQDAVVIVGDDGGFTRIDHWEISDKAFFFNEDSEGLMRVEEYGTKDDWYGHELTDESYNTIVPPGAVFVYDNSFDVILKPKES